MLEVIRSLADYHYWANRRLLEQVELLSEEQFSRDLGSSFASIQATLAHLLNAEAIWLTRILERTVAGVTPQDLPAPAAARRRWQPLETELRQLVGGLGESDLNRPVTARTSTGQVHTNRLDHVLHHLFNHGTYHRGQLSAMLRQVGAASVPTDLIRYYRQNAPDGRIS